MRSGVELWENILNSSLWFLLAFTIVHTVAKLPSTPINPMSDILTRKSLKMVGPLGEDLTSSGGKQSYSEPDKIPSESKQLITSYFQENHCQYNQELNKNFALNHCSAWQFQITLFESGAPHSKLPYYPKRWSGV